MRGRERRGSSGLFAVDVMMRELVVDHGKSMRVFVGLWEADGEVI